MAWIDVFAPAEEAYREAVLLEAGNPAFFSTPTRKRTAMDCPRCGDPLPLDGRCDCRGSDRDPRLLRALRRDRVLTNNGMKRLYEPDQVADINRNTQHEGWERAYSER